MQVWHDMSEVESGMLSGDRTVVTIGNFDGVHLGHRHVIARAHEVAAELGGLPVVAVTFDPHPLSVIVPDRAPQPLMSLERRLALLADAGADATLVLTFTKELAAVTAEDFVTRTCSTGCTPRQSWSVRTSISATARSATSTCSGGCAANVPSGSRDYRSTGTGATRCGHRRTSVAVSLRATSRLRPRRSDARSRSEGVVVKGDHRGRELGYPPRTSRRVRTVAVPADGVYAGRLAAAGRAGGAAWPAAV